MLPFLELVNAKPRIHNFRQRDDFCLGHAPHTKFGACIGLSFDWIRHHQLGKMDTFVSEINTPNRIAYIEDFIFNYKNRGGPRSMILKVCLSEINLKHKLLVEWHIPVSHMYIAETLVESEGYFLIAYKSRTRRFGHVVAFFNSDQGCEFFDPNYGSAFFIKKNHFIRWYETFFWFHAKNRETGENILYDLWSISQYIRS